jgi:hypothetical protein
MQKARHRDVRDCCRMGTWAMAGLFCLHRDSLMDALGSRGE